MPDYLKDFLTIIPALSFVIGGVWSIAAIRDTTNAATLSINELKEVLVDLKEWIQRIELTTVTHGERLARLETVQELKKTNH